MKGHDSTRILFNIINTNTSPYWENLYSYQNIPSLLVTSTLLGAYRKSSDLTIQIASKLSSQSNSQDKISKAKITNIETSLPIQFLWSSQHILNLILYSSLIKFASSILKHYKYIMLTLLLYYITNPRIRSFIYT